MRESALEWLACPVCRDALVLAVEESTGDSIRKGRLACGRCGAAYPIIDGIPRFLGRDDAAAHGHWDDLWVQTQLEAPIRRVRFALEHAGGEQYYAMLGLARQVLASPVERCVEIGCGSGSYSLMLRRVGFARQSILVDFSLQALHLARALFGHFHTDCTLILADGRFLPLQTDSCGLSVSGGVLEHFGAVEQNRLVAEHCRVARAVLCQVPLNGTAYWVLRMGVTIAKCGWPFGHEWPLSRGRMRRLLSTEGYQIEAESYHDWLTAAFFLLSTRLGWPRPLGRKTFFNRLFQHEFLVCATERL